MKQSLTESLRNETLRGFVLFVSFLFTILYFLTPLYGDDLWFLVGTNLSESRWDTFMLTLEGTASRWHTETGRFANIMSSPFIALFPKWLLDILCGFMVWCMLSLSLKLASTKGNNTTGWLLIAALVLFLPWYDSMLSRMFTLNYVWTSVFDLFFILMMFRTLGNARRSAGVVMALSLFSFAAGWLHEGFSVPIIAAFIIIILRRRLRRLPVSRIAYLFLTLFCLGAAMITLSPVFWQRAGGEGTTFFDMPAWEIAVMVGPAVMLFLVLIIIIAVKHRIILKDEKKTEMLILSVTVSVVSLLITSLFFGGPRACFLMELIDFIAIAQFLQSGSDQTDRVSVPALIVRYLCVVAVTVNMCAAITAQEALQKEDKEITRLFKESDDGTVYYDNIAMKPDISLLKTSVGQFNLKNLIIDFSYYHRPSHTDPDSQKLLQLLPSSLEGFTGFSANQDASCYPVVFKGNILIPTALLDSISPKTVIIETDAMPSAESRFRTVFFTTPDSVQWALIKPHAGAYRKLNIKRARFSRED